MLRKVLFAVFGLFITMSAHAGQAINVEWVHKFVKQEHGLDIPYADNPKLVVNMEYVLKVVDMANAYFNGDGWTNYGESEYATREVADTVAGIYCIRNLIERYYFTATTTPDTTSFSFQIGAAGAYHVDWGDGKRDHYYKTHTISRTISHTYANAGEYKIRIGGYSSQYNGTISFSGNKQLAGISGSLGKIFPTLKGPNGPIQPTFSSLFYNCTNLTGAIPEELFYGVHGQPINFMFSSIFSGCAGLGTNISQDDMPQYMRDGYAIPPKLFSGIYGTPTVQLFRDVFYGCKGLSGRIPQNLFGGERLKGPPAGAMFYSTFSGCSGLIGEIPNFLFGQLIGPYASDMFYCTFAGCTGLTGAIPTELFSQMYGQPQFRMFGNTFGGCTGLGTNISEDDMPQYMRDGYAIPPKLFGNIYGTPIDRMFASTFTGCSGLNGTIPPDLFGGVTNDDGTVLHGEPAAEMFSYTFNGCTKLTGIIPETLFGLLTGTPKQSMFNSTFAYCYGLTGPIPDYLFGDLYGAPAPYMFHNTFYSCVGLTSIPETLFGKISGAVQTYMFRSAFTNCRGLSGESAKVWVEAENKYKYLYEVWPEDTVTEWSVGGMYRYATNLSDYDQIPAVWK